MTGGTLRESWTFEEHPGGRLHRNATQANLRRDWSMRRPADLSGEYLNLNETMTLQELSQKLQEHTFNNQKPETESETSEK